MVVLMHVEGGLVPAQVADHDGGRPAVRVSAGTARFGSLPEGTLASLPLAMRSAEELRPVTRAFREGCPGMPVTLLIAARRTERKMAPALLFGLIGAAIDEAFASHEDRKSRAALEEALGSELGRDLASFSEEHGWTLRSA